MEGEVWSEGDGERKGEGGVGKKRESERGGWVEGEVGREKERKRERRRKRQTEER